MSRTLIVAFLCILLGVNTGCNNTNGTETTTGKGLNVKVLTDNLSHPWEIAWGPDQKLWITERGGRISRIDPVTGKRTTVATLSEVKSKGEGGLLGMAFHPDFSSNPYIFVVYNYDKEGTYTEKVVRYKYSNGSLSVPVKLLDNIRGGNIHNGSRLLIVGNKLFITTGETGNGKLAQDKTSLNGKIMRINLDGSIPADNPDPSSPVWTFGHRNAQGLVYANNKLYSSEHGATTNDEINIILKGRNYGWPNVEGKCDDASEQAFCKTHNVAEPIFSWSPTIAPSGMDYYNKALIPEWKNSLLLAVLKNSVLIQLKLNPSGDKIISTKEYLKNEYGRLRDVCVAPDGKVYVLTANGDDQVLVISGEPK